VAAQDAWQSTAAEGRGQHFPVSLDEDIADSSFGDFAFLVGEDHILKTVIASFFVKPVIGLATRGLAASKWVVW
jgi:hypothetical protein